MPEPQNGGAQDAAAAPSESNPLDDFLERMVEAGPRVWGVPPDEDEEPRVTGAESTADTSADGLAETATESDETDDAQAVDATRADDAGRMPELDDVDGDGAEPGSGGDQAGGVPSRRQYGALLTQREQERDAAIAERDQALKDLNDLRARSGPVDDTAARAEVLEFLGMVKREDEDEPVFSRLHRAASSEEGIEFRDEQREYHELTQRGAMVGKIFGLARRQAWADVGDELLDADYGIDQPAVEAAGSITNWKQSYRSRIEQTVTDRLTRSHQDEIAQLRADHKRQVDELNRKLTENATAFDARLARARGVRAPVGAGQSAPARNGQAGVAASSGDPVSELTDFLRESAEARAR